MKTLHACNEHAQLMLTGGRPPDMNTLALVEPRRPAYLRRPAGLHFASCDEAFAWTVTRLARRLAYAHRAMVNDADAATRLALETWVIAPRQDGAGVLAPLFHPPGEREGERLVLHAGPSYHGGHQVPLLWEDVYDRVWCKKRVRLLSECGGAASEPFGGSDGRVLLNMCLTEAGEYHRAIERLIRQSGHPYWYSSGGDTPS